MKTKIFPNQNGRAELLLCLRRWHSNAALSRAFESLSKCLLTRLKRAFRGALAASVLSVSLWPILTFAQTTIQFYLAQFTGSTNDTTINLRAQNNPIIYRGVFYWMPSSGTNLTTTNGFASLSLIPGQYHVSLAGIPQSWTITVTNSATPLNAAGLTTDTLIYNGINSLAGNAVTNDGYGNYTVNADPPGAAAAAFALAVTNTQAAMTFGNHSVSSVTIDFGGQQGNGSFWGWNETISENGFNFGGGPVIAGSFTGDGSGLTDLPATANGSTLPNLNGYNAIVGQLLLQNAATLSLQTNGTSPFTGTNWSALTMQTTPTLTNSPAVALYCGYPTNSTDFGYLPSLAAWIYPSTGGVNCQTPEMRLKLTVYGNCVGLYTEDGNGWWRSDGSQWSSLALPSAGNNIFWTFTWPNFGRHEFEFQWNNLAGLVGLYCPATNALVNTPQPVQTGIIIGDSVTDGAAGVGGESLWPAHLQDLLMPYGINLVPQGEGGTGYTVGGVGGGTNFLYRLTNGIVAWKPNFVIWAGGNNNQGTSNLLYAAATKCYGLLNAALPSCKQIVIAPWNDSNPASGDSVGINQIISNAAAVYGLPVIYPQYTLNSSWMSGYQSIPGSGNAPLFETGIGPHPTALGHQFIADMLANFVLTNLIPNATLSLW